MTPVRHWLLLGLQAEPVAHETQLPPLHTWLVPHGVPSPTLVRPAQVEAPVAHEVVPVLQRLPLGLHEAPDVQATHWPPEHTWLVPHVVPSLAALFVSAHTMPPSAHDAVPEWQGLAGVHGAPFVHGAQVAPLQKRLVPHGLPLGALPPEVQTGAPVAHAIVACWQDPASLQSIPEEQGEQVPLLHTPPSHVVPFVPVPVGEHFVSPASVHTSMPVSQGAGAQGIPGTHGTAASCSDSKTSAWVVLTSSKPESAASLDAVALSETVTSSPPSAPEGTGGSGPTH